MGLDCMVVYCKDWATVDALEEEFTRVLNMPRDDNYHKLWKDIADRYYALTKDNVVDVNKEWHSEINSQWPGYICRGYMIYGTPLDNDLFDIVAYMQDKYAPQDWNDVLEHANAFLAEHSSMKDEMFYKVARHIASLAEHILKEPDPENYRFLYSR